MNVLLISTYELGHQPLGLASPAAHLKARDFPVECLDLAVERLDPEAVRRVVAEIQPLVRDPDELHDALVLLGFIPEAEAGQQPWREYLDALSAQRRAPQARDWVDARIPSITFHVDGEPSDLRIEVDGETHERGARVRASPGQSVEVVAHTPGRETFATSVTLRSATPPLTRNAPPMATAERSLTRSRAGPSWPRARAPRSAAKGTRWPVARVLEPVREVPWT